MRPISPTPISDLQRFTKLGEFATRQQTDTQRSTVAQLTAQIAADDAAISNAQTQLDYTDRQGADLGRRRPAPGRRRQHRQCCHADRHRDASPRIEPIAVIFTAPEDQLPVHQRSAIAAAAQGDRDVRPTASSVLTERCRVINNQVDTTSGHYPPRRRCSTTRTSALWPGQSVSTRAAGEDAEGCDRRFPTTRSSTAPTASTPMPSIRTTRPSCARSRSANSIDGRSVVDDGLVAGPAGDHGRPVHKVQPGALVCHGSGEFGSGAIQGQAGMSDGISAPFIRYPIGTSLLMAGILFVGLVAYPLLPVAPLPQVDFPTIQVTASLPGGSPETMASSVAQPLERQFAQIPGVAQMTSTSYLGTDARSPSSSTSTATSTAPPTTCRRAINAAGGQLPKNLPRRRPIARSIRRISPILLLSATSDTLPLTTVERRRRRPACAADQPDLRRGAGHRSAASRNRRSASRSIRRSWSPRACRWRTCAARSRSRPSTARRATSTATTRAYTIYANDQLTASKDWNDVIVAYRNGGPLRIRDIGQAVTGPEDAKQAAWANGKRGVFLVVFKQPGANVIDTVDKIKATAAAAGRGDPAGDQDRHHQRPHPDHPRRGRGRAVHAVADHRAGRDGDLPVPAQLLGDRDPERHGAAGAARRLLR